eukprot:3605014-Amphidinium_carterae.1
MAKYDNVPELQIALGRHIQSPQQLPHYSQSMGSRVERKHLLGHQALMREMYMLHPSLSFGNEAMVEALYNMSDGWFENEESRCTFARVGGKRLRVMCRHLSQAIIKARGSN